MVTKAITLYAITLSFLIVSIVFILLSVTPISVSGYTTEEVPCFESTVEYKTSSPQVQYYETKCITWDKTHLTYHITNELDPKYSDYYRFAFGVWQYYLNGTLTFAEVKQSYKSDIHIKITENGSCDGALGCTELQHAWGYFTEVYVYTSNKECQYSDVFSSCVDINDKKFWLAALHETGHSLGLSHTPDNLIEPIDIMYYKIEPGLTMVSNADIWKLKTMYEKPNIVEMKNAPYDVFGDAVQFIPDRITIKQGETVTWINEDDTDKDRGLHTVTSGTPTGEWGTVFDSGNKAMRPGDSFSVTFTEKGEYPYLCALHPWMLGKITVI